ncbi:MAG: hypothetical protein IKP47_05040 [Ruminococcus sp.]|nr:hypothetical protein [Ruminococcus sp.]
MENTADTYNISSYDDNEDLPEMPEECAESEKAIGELRRRTNEDKFTFINVIVLAVVLLGCAAYFISLTSSKRYGDEGNKFSFERLANGKYTAEISRRYYSTIAFPEGFDDLAEGISSLYGIGSGVDYSNPSETGANNAGSNDPQGNKPQGGGHSEKTVTTADTSASSAESTVPREVQTFYDTIFSRTTTVSTELGWDPDDPYSHKTSATTTTNNTEPQVSSTTTAVPTKVTEPTAPSTSESKTKPTETKPTESKTETSLTEDTKPTDTESSSGTDATDIPPEEQENTP